jgi:hypothetical protein
VTEGVRVYPNVRWVDRTRPDAPLREGEHLEVSPFEQASIGGHVIADKIAEHPDWHGGGPSEWEPPRSIHAVRFPDSERARLDRAGEDLGPEAPLELGLCPGFSPRFARPAALRTTASGQ